MSVDSAATAVPAQGTPVGELRDSNEHGSHESVRAPQGGSASAGEARVIDRGDFRLPPLDQGQVRFDAPASASAVIQGVAVGPATSRAVVGTSNSLNEVAAATSQVAPLRPVGEQPPGGTGGPRGGGTRSGLVLQPGIRYGSFLYTPTQARAMEEARALDPGKFLRIWLEYQPFLPIGLRGAGHAIVYICE